jgi:hypothetical protein
VGGAAFRKKATLELNDAPRIIEAGVDLDDARATIRINFDNAESLCASNMSAILNML